MYIWYFSYKNKKKEIKKDKHNVVGEVGKARNMVMDRVGLSRRESP